MIANKYRPKRFSEMVGQDSEIERLVKLSGKVARGSKVPAVCFTGPFGNGKTTLARLWARAVLCSNRDATNQDPCGRCVSCEAMDRADHPAYAEVNPASADAVIKAALAHAIIYLSASYGMSILAFDEAHMLSRSAQKQILKRIDEGIPPMISLVLQKALLGRVEEERAHLMFIFCTNDPKRMTETLLSRCVVVNLKLLTAAEITSLLRQVCVAEAINADDQALQIIGTYAKGHVRDALMLLDTVAMAGKVSEELVRIYLRLDRHNAVYELLAETDPRAGFQKLEVLLYTHGVAALAELISEVFIDAHELRKGIGDWPQVDKVWMERVSKVHGSRMRHKAKELLLLNRNRDWGEYGLAAFSRILWGMR